MALSDLFMICPPLFQSLFDKDTALAMANGTVSFYQDTSRMTPKAVYELGGFPNYEYTALPNPVSLNGSGQPTNAANVVTTIYLYPYDENGNVENYYIVIENEDGDEQITLEGWPNLDPGGNAETANNTSIDNQISNPQFSEVYINVGNDPSTSNPFETTYTVAGAEETFSFAPDWDFVIDGTGTVTVSRVEVAGSSDTLTNPPYYISIVVSSGISKCWLRQRMRVNSGLWSSSDDQDIYLSGGILAEGVGTEQAVKMYYLQSTGGTALEVINDAAPTGAFTYLVGTSAISPSSSDTNTGEDGYVDIYLSFDASQSVNLTSVQVIPVFTPDGGDALSFKYNSSNRNIAYLSDYYNPALSRVTQGNILTGWDFHVNPGQFGNSGTLGTALAYTLDQTIASSSSGAAAWTRDTQAALQITSSGANDQIVIAQYLIGREVKKIVGNKLSLNIQAWQGTVGSPTQVRAYLCRATAAAVVPTLGSGTPFIGTFDGSGVFTPTVSGWSLINRNGLGTATGIVSQFATTPDINTDYDLQFSQWEIEDTADIIDTDALCLILTFVPPTTATVLHIQSVNLCTGDIPSRPTPEPFGECLRKCQYYYEKSYDWNVAAGTVTDDNEIVSSTEWYFYSGSLARVATNPFWFAFKQTKRTPPTIDMYSPTSATINQLLVNGYSGSTDTPTDQVVPTFTDYWTITSSLDSAVSEVTTDNSTLLTITGSTSRHSAEYRFHYVADARLGVV